MDWTIEHRPDQDILYLKSSGVMDVESANAMVADLVGAASRYACRRHLVDHRATTFTFNLVNYFERPAINEKIGVSITWKTAMVFAESNQETHFMETVFRNRGYNFREFTDVEAALSWLLER